MQALFGNKTGNFNTASGTDALYSNTSGSTNIAEGYKAGYNLTTGSNNIDIGSPGVAAESGVIRIGTITGTTSTQSAAYIAGINGIPVSSGVPVVVGTNGQLGVASSSERFKTSITPMGSSTEKLGQLRPVTFQYKSDPHGAKQYGLIAEEVANTYPELAVRDQQGHVISVRYDELAPMLLNEAQKQAATIRALKQQQFRTQQEMAELKALNQATQVALRKLQARDQLVAQR